MKKLNTLIVFCILSFTVLTAQTTDVYTGISGRPGRMLRNGTDLYVTLSESNKLIKIDLSVDPPVAVDVFEGLKSPCSMALNGNDLYIALYEDDKISKIDISSKNPILIDVVLGVFGANGLALVGNDLYVSESSIGRISKIDITESNPTLKVVVTDVNFPGPILYKDNYLYISEILSNKISKIDVSSPTPTPVDVITDLFGPLGFRIFENTLYATQMHANKVSKIDLSAAIPVAIDIATDVDNPTDLIFLGNDIYISEHNSQKISKLDNVIIGECVANAGEDKVLCDFNEIQLGGNPIVFGGLAPYSYSWSISPLTNVLASDFLSDTAVANPILQTSGNEVFVLEVTDANNKTCKDSLRIYSPKWLVTLDQKNQETTPNTPVQLYTSVYSENSVLTYLWSPTNGLSNPNIKNPIAITDKSITYNLLVTDSEGCEMIDDFDIIINGTNISGVSQNKLITVKETAGNYLFEIDDFTNKYFELYEITGRKIIGEHFTSNQIMIKKSDLHSGIYIFKVMDNNSVVRIGKIKVN